MSERRVVCLENDGIEKVRNVGLREASDLMRRYLRNKSAIWERFPRTFYLPEQPVVREEAEKYKITGEGDLLGGIIDDRNHGGKGVLHEAVGDAPDWYNDEFAASMKDYVLPGYTVFNEASAREAFAILKGEQRAEEIRLKDPRGAGGMRQSTVKSEDELPKVLNDLYEDDPAALFEHGVVLEANLKNPQELIVGTLAVGEESYSYYGWKKKNHITSLTCLTMVKGGFRPLLKKRIPEQAAQAVDLAAGAMERYRDILGATTHRAVFDVVRGESAGQECLGVADTSMRVTGSWPAELSGANRLSIMPLKRDAVMAIGRIGYLKSYNEDRWLEDDENYECVRYNPQTGLSRYVSVYNMWL